MSTTTQNLILDAIADRVPARFTFVRDGDWANTGTLRTFDGNLDLVAEVRYDFQRSSCRFGSMMAPVAVHYYGKTRGPGHIDAVKSTIADTVDAVVTYLTGASR